MSFPLAQRIFLFIINDFGYLEMNPFIKKKLEIINSIYDWIFFRTKHLQLQNVFIT
jgi:hypothetical protein